MQIEEFEKKFHELFSGVAELYGQSPSPAVFEIWFMSLSRFEIQDITRAFSVHIQDPDTGRFMPKPADVIRIIDGSGKDSAFLAWTKIEKSIRMVGKYQSVVFDDPIIHRVIQDMGGWIRFCGTDEDELPFTANEFRRRYQAYKSSGATPDYLPRLAGLTEAENRANGYTDSIPEPVLIGSPEKARRVMLGGSYKPSLQITHESEQLKKIGTLKIL